ncbi:MAG: hypothetical protein D8M59_03295 [Planctomycetes bacterium]|nr:hypothetical protein [Planctomycetota bacterium]NOG53022.1 type 4a pilus biogenesis protein PilO [Planctomycetota bacterium]
MKIGLRGLFFVIILLSVPVAAFKFVFLPRNIEIALAKSEIQDKQQKLEQLREAGSRINDLETAIAALKEAVTLIEAKLPPEEKVDDVVRQAWEIARGHELVNKGVQPSKVVPAVRYRELPIELDLEGDFDGFYAFLLELEQLPRVTRIKEMKLERVDEDLGIVHAKFVLSVYFQPLASKTLLAGAPE